MDMLPPVSAPSYSAHNQQLLEAVRSEVMATQQSVSAHLHELQGALPDDITDVTVTCDGTWSRRGFSALYGVVVVASWESGQVMDFEVL